MDKGVVVFDFDGTLIKFDSTKLIILLCFILSPYRFVKSFFKYLKNKNNYYASEYFLSNTISGKNVTHVKRVFVIYKIICKMNLNKNILKRLMEIKNKGYAIFIASASPVFAIRLVIPDIPILGHDYQIKNKKYTGKTNNKMPIRQEKLKQLIEHINRMGSSEIEIAFSDSICDAPLLNYAKKSYLIKRNKIEIWRKNSEIKQSKC